MPAIGETAGAAELATSPASSITMDVLALDQALGPEAHGAESNVPPLPLKPFTAYKGGRLTPLIGMLVLAATIGGGLLSISGHSINHTLRPHYQATLSGHTIPGLGNHTISAVVPQNSPWPVRHNRTAETEAHSTATAHTAAHAALHEAARTYSETYTAANGPNPPARRSPPFGPINDPSPSRGPTWLPVLQMASWSIRGAGKWAGAVGSAATAAGRSLSRGLRAMHACIRALHAPTCMHMAGRPLSRGLRASAAGARVAARKWALFAGSVARTVPPPLDESPRSTRETSWRCDPLLGPWSPGLSSSLSARVCHLE